MVLASSLPLSNSREVEEGPAPSLPGAQSILHAPAWCHLLQEAFLDLPQAGGDTQAPEPPHPFSGWNGEDTVLVCLTLSYRGPSQSLELLTITMQTWEVARES